MTPSEAYYHALYTIQGPYPQGESTIAQDPQYAYLYAITILKNKFPQAEHTIATDPEWAYYYARNIIKGRYYHLEKSIIKSRSNILKRLYNKAININHNTSIAYYIDYITNRNQNHANFHINHK